MAKAASFDIVSQVDLQEVTNAVDQATREIAQRYDFKGSATQIDWDRKNQIEILTDNEYRLEAVVEILKQKMVRRSVPIRSLQFGKAEPASGGLVRQDVEVAQGISTEKGKEIVAAIKKLKLKVQAQVMEDQVRVTGKSRDDLQAVIQALKESDFDLDLQFVNFRS